MAKKNKKQKPNIKRDLNILKSQQGEINLSTRTVPDKTKYKRKIKHKNKQF